MMCFGRSVANDDRLIDIPEAIQIIEKLKCNQSFWHMEIEIDGKSHKSKI